jgi:hypothetical protein
LKLFFYLQQLFRSQNPGLTNAGASGQNGGLPQALPLAQAQQQFLAAQQSAAYAAQQAAPYVINPGQEANPYMGALINVPQYYGVAAPWGVYPSTHLIPQQGSQPRRPLTPSQQGAENQQYQVSLLLHYNIHLKCELSQTSLRLCKKICKKNNILSFN